jgi:hypothetical protein
MDVPGTGGLGVAGGIVLKRQGVENKLTRMGNRPES